MSKNQYKENTIKALNWSFAGAALTQIIRIGISIVLARLIVPEEFGLLAMVLVWTGFLTVAQDIGLAVALIQKKVVEEIEYHSVFWFNIFLGILLTVLTILISPFLANFYKEPRLIELTYLLALTFIISSFGIIHEVKLKKNSTLKDCH